MGQKINPKSIRITGGVQNFVNSLETGGFTNLWFSDFNYCSFLYQDFFIKKSQIRILMKYYKTKVRFLKGRRRRFKSLLRISNYSFLHLPYKKYLLCSMLRPSDMGLQRKHTAFLFKKQRTALKNNIAPIGMYESYIKNKERLSILRVPTYSSLKLINLKKLAVFTSIKV